MRYSSSYELGSSYNTVAFIVFSRFRNSPAEKSPTGRPVLAWLSLADAVWTDCQLPLTRGRSFSRKLHNSWSVRSGWITADQLFTMLLLNHPRQKRRKQSEPLFLDRRRSGSFILRVCRSIAFQPSGSSLPESGATSVWSLVSGAMQLDQLKGSTSTFYSYG